MKMIEFLGSLIANGSIYGEWGYQPWLPFYNFGICMGTLGLILAISLLTSSKNMIKYSMIIIAASILSLISTYALWTIMYIEPNIVLVTWGALLIVFSYWINRLVGLYPDFEPSEDSGLWGDISEE